MKVYLTGAFEHMDRRVGFGNASYHIYNSMKKLGIDVNVKELGNNTRYEADIEICFDQPHDYKFMCSTSYKIGYTPWESTEFMPAWWNPLHKVDEVWAPNFFTYDVFKNKLPNKKIFTYQHGIDHAYKPRLKKYNSEKPFTFLFIGEPYWRKDGDLVARTFAKLYGNNPDYRLIIKCSKLNTIKLKDEQGFWASPDVLYDNIICITSFLSPEQMIELYDAADVFVYPTWGEGFGFNPLQAIAMGIPTITTTEWCDYRDYITVPIGSNFQTSPWQEIHPGGMYRPNAHDLARVMGEAKENHSDWCKLAFKNSFEVHKKFDWIRVTKPAVHRLKKIYENRELKKLA